MADAKSFTRAGERLARTPRNLQTSSGIRNSDIKFEHALKGEAHFGAPEDFAITPLPGILSEYARAYPHVRLSVTCEKTFCLMTPACDVRHRWLAEKDS